MIYDHRYLGLVDETISIQKIIENVIVCEERVDESVFYNFGDQKMLAQIAFFYTLKGHIIYNEDFIPPSIQLQEPSLKETDAYRRKGEC